MKKQLKIYCAGVAQGLVRTVVKNWEETHPDCEVIVIPGGSVDLIRRIRDGETCDLMISADDMNIRQLLIPEYTDECILWAGNAMVLASVCGEDITGQDWKKLLLAPDAVFTHMYAAGDPAGYRAVMALKLAEDVESGLAEALLKHPGYIGMDAKPGRPDFSKAKYAIVYESMAKARRMSYVKLPPQMDLSDEAHRTDYAHVHHIVNGNSIVTGTPIRHGLAILKASEQQVLANEFVQDFLVSDFAAAGFLPLK